MARIECIPTVEANNFILHREFQISKSRKLFARRKQKRTKIELRSDLYNQVEVMIAVQKLFCLWPLKSDFSPCYLTLILFSVTISVWAWFSLKYARTNVRGLFIATARYILTVVRLVFCCLSVISSYYLYIVNRSSLHSFFQGMAQVDSVLRNIDCCVPYPKNISFAVHSLITFFLIFLQTNFFSRLSFLLEVQNQYRYCVFVVIHLFYVLLNSLSHRFHLLSSLLKDRNLHNQSGLYTLITVHKQLCDYLRKLRKIYSLQIIMILAVIDITYIWNIHRFCSIIFRFEDELAKSKVINIKSRAVMITLYTYWLLLIANAGESLKNSAINFHEELYYVIISDETKILSKDMVLKAYLRMRPTADYVLCKIIKLDNKIIIATMGITVSYIVISIQLSVPCSCKNGVPNHFI